MIQKLIYVKNKTNRGYSVGINQGLKISNIRNSTYSLVTNNDIYFYPQTINELLKSIQENKFRYITAIDKKRNWKSVHDQYLKGDLYWVGLCMSCFITSKNIIEMVGYFDENIFPGNYEDMDWMHRAALLTISGRSYLPAIIEHDHGHTQKKYNFNTAEILNKNRDYVNKKHKISLGW